MTVIAWKDGIIAADRATTLGTLQLPTRKLIRFGNVVLASCGPVDFGQALINWYRDGAKIESWPKCQERNDYGILVVAKQTGVYVYYQMPVWLDRSKPYGALGDGAEVAVGAMAAGASAERAVEICNLHCSTCGFGVDVERYQD